MIILFILIIILLFIIAKYFTGFGLFAFDFIAVGFFTYHFLNPVIGKSYTILVTIAALALYGGLLYYLSVKQTRFGKIIHYLASFFGAFYGTSIAIFFISGILKSLGVLKETYMQIALTNNKIINWILHLIIVYYVSKFIYKKRMKYLRDKFAIYQPGSNDIPEFFEYLDDDDAPKSWKNVESNHKYKARPNDDYYEREDIYDDEYEEEYDNEDYKNNDRYSSYSNDRQNITDAKNYYKILAVDTDATQEEIKRAYHEAMSEFHPDKHNNSKGANEITKMLNEAYAVLSDEEKRAQYDRFGTTTD